jgi:hypothetical protein
MAMETKNRGAWVYPLVLLGGVSAAWFLLLLGFDYVVFYGPKPEEATGFWGLLSGYNEDEAQFALGNLPQVIVGVLGIAITVVSIILQLSATRYTPRVTEMFFRDRTNLWVMGFFVVASVHSLWATLTIRKSFIPHSMVILTLVMMTMSILIMVPYFAYVFAFLEPERIVKRLQEQALAEAAGRGRTRIGEVRQERVQQGVEQLADVAVNSISQKDRIIASRSVDALRDLVLHYIELKPSLDPDWFQIGPLLRRNPDFVSMASPSVDTLSAKHTWVEWKVLRQYQTIYNESLNRMRDINQLVAIDTRYIGEKALGESDREVLELAIKFFNTYLRSTVNERDVRTAYNVLHQYRLLAEAVLRKGWGEAVIAIAQHFNYYGQTAASRELTFINETVAYDLCTLCELAHLNKFQKERELLGIFLEVDKPPETEAQELSLRGVRKAQLKLATFYLEQGSEDLARRIFVDMEHERPERLASIRAEMLAVQNLDFWEVIDRGQNFDYLEPQRKAQLERFFGWFAEKGG